MNNTHTIGIKNLKHFASMSEETYCFTCSVTLDGVKTWEAKNNGQGEETRLYYIKPTTEGGGKKHDTNAIIKIVDKCVEDAVMEKQKVKDMKAVAKKLCNTLCFRVKGQQEGAYFHIRTSTPNDPAFRSKVFAKHPEREIDTIINDLPIEQAVHFFYKYA
jgi:hypothetical protein